MNKTIAQHYADMRLAERLNKQQAVHQSGYGPVGQPNQAELDRRDARLRAMVGVEMPEDTGATLAHDPVDHPQHYTAHPSGVECIQITEHMGFCLGNAVKYIWRADLKHDAVEDLKKARWYLDHEIAKRTAGGQQP